MGHNNSDNSSIPLTTHIFTNYRKLLWDFFFSFKVQDVDISVLHGSIIDKMCYIMQRA